MVTAPLAHFLDAASPLFSIRSGHWVMVIRVAFQASEAPSTSQNPFPLPPSPLCASLPPPSHRHCSNAH